MSQFNSEITVAGIDIGGTKKGCHLVILRGREILCNINSNDHKFLASQCNHFGVIAVGIDSPCRWGKPNHGRMAEKQLAKERIFCFATPTRERATTHSPDFYGWMLNGERVYLALAATHPSLNDEKYTSGQVCFETFPHAITCAMLGTDIASAKRKRVQRRQILEDSGIDTQSLKSIDDIDAALCALTASHLILNKTKVYGDADGGYIFVPDLSGLESSVCSH